jgi:hypothetical protein
MMRTRTFLIGFIIFFTPMLAGQAAAQDCVEPPPGLVSWWPGDENASDIAGNNDGTLQGGATFAPGMVDQAFSLDGMNDYVDVGAGFDLDAMTIDAWVFIDVAENTGNRRVVSKDNFQSFGARKLFELSSTKRFIAGTDGHPAFAVEIGGTDVVASPTPLAAGWHHLAGVRDTAASRFELYVDGLLVAQKVPTVMGAVDSQVNTVIGRVSPTAPIEHFNGLIDEVEVYGRALSATEIRAIFDAGSAGKCKPLPPPTIEELLQRIEDLEAAVEEVSDHTHTYRTGRGRGHNNAEAETSPAEEPSDDPNPPMTPLGAGFRVRPLSR